MPFKKTDEGFEYGEEGDHVLNKRSKSNPFTKDRTIRDSSNRPLKWDEKLGDYVVDTKKWIDETNEKGK